MKKVRTIQRVSRRKFLKQSGILTGAAIASSTLARATCLLNNMPPDPLRVVVLGDSAMWGQGLRESQKYSNKSIKLIGDMLHRQTRITNFARSGAAILAGATEREQEQKRRDFVDTYPARFGAKVLTAGLNDLEKKFILENEQDIALLINPEIPSTFPTISYQVQLVPPSVANNAEIVLLNGGANDIDFEDVLNPEEHRNDFAKTYHPLIREAAYERVKSLLRQARERFPRAVIIYAGYFSPFAPGKSNGRLRNLFEHLSGAEAWMVWTNKHIIEIKDVDQLVKEAQFRSQFAFTRGLFWGRKAVAEANADARLRGPGFLFIHPQFKPENTVFEENSFFHRSYKLSEIHDPAKQMREGAIERLERFDEMRQLYVSFMSNAGINTKFLSERLLRNLNGSGRLIKALSAHVNDPADTSLWNETRDALSAEMHRINRAKMASFLHPNEKGAERYSQVISKRFKERIHRIQLANDLSKFPRKNGALLTISQVAEKYNLSAGHINDISMSQMMLVDSIAVEITTANNSTDKMFDDIVIDVGTQLRWRITFPPRVIRQTATNAFAFKILNTQMFAPGETNMFTIDAGGIHLSKITQFALVRKENDDIKNAFPDSFSSEPWKISKITLFINGIEVFEERNIFELRRGGQKNFSYPNR